MPHELYGEFVRCNMMAPDAYEDWQGVAFKSILKRLSEDRQEALSFNQMREADKLKDQIDSLNEQSDYVTREAKKFAVRFLYKTAKEKGYKNLFVRMK